MVDYFQFIDRAKPDEKIRGISFSAKFILGQPY